MDVSRRAFLGRILTTVAAMSLGERVFVEARPKRPDPLDVRATVYRAVNGSPPENLEKVLEMMGGIEGLIGSEDIVLIKPNVQWWNQGAPNLGALSALVGMIVDRPGGFRGEVVIGENCHRGREPWKSSGWAAPFSRNGGVHGVGSMTDLVVRLKNKYGDRFSVCHWMDVDCGGKRINGPQDGPGYVYCDGTGGVPLVSIENRAGRLDRRATIMTYPVFKTDQGTIVDFKNGIWEKGSHTGQPLKFINVAALNHHSTYCGVTSAVKNYLGVTDLSGGPNPYEGGRLTGEYFNFHSFPYDEWAPGPVPGMLGAEIGVFMNTVRKADLNITTAEWVGLASRTEPPVARTRALLASKDPVALDYHAAKYVVYPNSGLDIHDPDSRKSPMREYLMKCAQEGGGTLDDSQVGVESYDVSAKRMQQGQDLRVIADITWGTDPKILLKYWYLRLLK